MSLQLKFLLLEGLAEVKKRLNERRVESLNYSFIKRLFKSEGRGFEPPEPVKSPRLKMT